jgi:protein-export membrane protein SecD/preprotein translocase SecF subunit
MFRNHWIRALFILLLAVVLAGYDAAHDQQLPRFMQEHCAAPETTDGPAISWFKERCLSLGLDLAGGTELRYRVDLGDTPVADRAGVVDGIRQVFDRRVNALGVSEPVVTPSTLNGQYYLTVELPGTKNISDAIQRVGKTVILEFKEQKAVLTDEEKKQDEEFNAGKKQAAEKARERAKSEDFAALMKETTENVYGRGGEFIDMFRDGNDPAKTVPQDLAAALFDKLKPGDVSDVHEVKLLTTVNGQTQEVLAGYSVVKLLKKDEAEQKIYQPAKATVTHILISYKGAAESGSAITRSKDEAQKLAQDLEARALKKEDFAALVKQYSDDASKTDNQGTFKDQTIGESDPTKNSFVKEFNDAVVAGKKGEIIGPVETAYGFHVIRIDDKTEKIDRTEKRPKVSYDEIFFATRIPSEWRETGLTGGNLVRAIAQPVPNSLAGYEVSLVFDDQGKKLFGEVTKRNVGKPVAIFLDGRSISEPVVQAEINTGEAVITGNFSAQEATSLARDLNTGALRAPVKLVDQRQIEASLGDQALAKSLKAGLIGLIVLAILLIAYYRLPGLVAAFALALYALLLLALFRFWPGYTLTLAGIAGTILSVGMATDANVLIFERLREELHAGKSLPMAVDQGFRRAWSSIRDSNFSSLITAGILTLIGTSVIRGFVLTLAIGIIASMFTAVWVTRGLLIVLMRTKLGERPALWATPKSGTHRHLPYMAWRKTFYAISAAVFVIAGIFLFTSGARLGQDFTGGSSMVFGFSDAAPTREQVSAALSQVDAAPAAPGFVQQKSAAPAAVQNGVSPLEGAQIIVGNDKTVTLKTKALDQAEYERLASKMDELNKGKPVQRVRFETTGPTIGEGLRQNAWKALLWAVILMIAYIAFAFRKVPAVASPWKFGVTAVVALLHDIFIAIGFFALMGRLFGWEMDTLFVTAMLTVFGFSVHDTIVVFDRIRENLILHGREKSIAQIADDSLNQTIARSIITSVTTMITLAALAIFGADSIRPFVVAMLFGIGIGTYSSIFVATPLLVDWQKKRIGKQA